MGFGAAAFAKGITQGFIQDYPTIGWLAEP
jgi:hypothetical protein